VSAGIAEALVETALGLVVAIPAVGFYQPPDRPRRVFNVEMDNSSSELVDYFIRKPRKQGLRVAYIFRRDAPPKVYAVPFRIR
jgi:biopolymer transport protein ExbB/biopolymer transport protein TolQ